MARQAKFGVSKTDRGWLVNVPASISETGIRSQRFFPTREKASQFAKNLKEGQKEFGQQSRTLSPGVAEDSAKASDILRPFGVSLAEAARFYALHHDLRSKAPTLAEAWKKAKVLRQNLSATYAATLRSWERRLPKDFLAKNIVDIFPSFISDALGEITNGATAWKTGLRIISAIMGDQVKEGALKENPCARVTTPKVKSHDEVKIYTVDELESLFAACKDYPKGLDQECSKCAVPFAFLAFAGIRPTELTRLTWDQVNLELSSIRLGGSVTKTGKTRNVRINTTLKAWIETVPEDQRNGKVIPGRWRFKATRVRREAGLNGHELQDALRHSYGSYMLATENNLDALKADMGHQHCEVFFAHYHNSMTKEQAAPYWDVLPARRTSDSTPSNK